MKRYIKWFAITIFISMLSACRLPPESPDNQYHLNK